VKKIKAIAEWGTEGFEDAVNEFLDEGWKRVSDLPTIYGEKDEAGSNHLLFCILMEREIPEPDVVDPKQMAILKVINNLGAYEFHAVIKALKAICDGDAGEADTIAEDYCRKHNSPWPKKQQSS